LFTELQRIGKKIFMFLWEIFGPKPLPLQNVTTGRIEIDLLPEIGTKLNMISYGGKGKKDAEEQAQ
jgi:hypothetical protein